MTDKNRYVLLLMLLIPFLLFSQKKTNFKTISFIQKDTITHLEEYKKDHENLDFFGSSVGEKKNSISKDSDFQKNLDKYTKTFYYKKINDSIIERSASDDPYSDSSIFINTKICKEFYDYPYPPNDFAFKIPFEDIKDLKIREFRKEKKMIKGIRCFKIKCSYTKVIVFDKKKEFPPEARLPDMYENIESEMWVTEDIKSIYHPVFKVKEILEKYYPLDILEIQSDIKGFERRYILEEITFQ